LRRHARATVAVFGLVFAVFVALQFRRGRVAPAPAAVVRTDPNAVIETTGGSFQRFQSSREDVSVAYEKLLTYSDGASKLVGVTITTKARGGSGREFVISAREGKVGQNESTIVLDGDVRLSSSDGTSARTEHATYTSTDGSVTASGPVEFAKGRISGRGVGLQYDKNRDVITILENATVHADAGEGEGADGAMDVTAGTAAFMRGDRLLRFDRAVRIRRGAQTGEAELAVAHLSADEKRIEALELHNHARITGSGGPGSLQAMAGADMTLNYAADGRSLQHALIVGDANAQLAGEPGKPGREVAAQTLEIGMAPDGTTPVSLTGRDAVKLTFPAEGDGPVRTVQAATLDASGEGGRGLTKAAFNGGVQFREKGAQVDRAARSTSLEVATKPGMGSIEEARFLHAVRFEEGSLAAQAAAARYDVVHGSLALTGSEPGFLTPRVVNDRIAVDATKIDVVLDGPDVKAAGAVKSTLQPSKPSGSAGPAGQARGGGDAKLPSMLKQDQPANVLADALAYDGAASIATYTGSARLFQGDTTIKGDTIAIDEKRGDLTASGKVMSTTIREQEGKDKKKERVQSTATAADMKYEDGPRKLTYTGAAHLVGPEGDITASTIELYLKPAGDDVERAEAYAEAKEPLTLREQTRTTTGARMTYAADRETYVVKGAPATVVDECGRETTGTTLTFVKSTDTIVVDGNQQIRTQTKGGSGKCQ
jgi:LPS export ABC transporter protein LptC/lipopolysaccharide transport protein LptA